MPEAHVHFRGNSLVVHEGTCDHAQKTGRWLKGEHMEVEP